MKQWKPPIPADPDKLAEAIVNTTPKELEDYRKAGSSEPKRKAPSKK